MYSGEFWVTFLSRPRPARCEHLGLAVQITADVEHLWRRHLAQPNPLAPWYITHLTRNTNSSVFPSCTANLTSPTTRATCSAPPNPTKIGSRLQQNGSKNDRRKMHVSYLYCIQYIYIIQYSIVVPSGTLAMYDIVCHSHSLLFLQHQYYNNTTQIQLHQMVKGRRCLWAQQRGYVCCILSLSFRFALQLCTSQN